MNRFWSFPNFVIVLRDYQVVSSTSDKISDFGSFFFFLIFLWN
jgi:hypothetical protein